MHAQITAYKGRLIFNLTTKKSIKDEVITRCDNPKSVGHVIIDTKKNLGVSKEALILLKQINKDEKKVGEMDWSKNERGSESFIWLGEANDIRKPENLIASKTYKVLSHVLIDNLVPDGARKAIDMVISKFKVK